MKYIELRKRDLDVYVGAMTLDDRLTIDEYFSKGYKTLPVLDTLINYWRKKLCRN